MVWNLRTIRPYSRIASCGVTFTVKTPGSASRTAPPEGGAPSSGATRSCAFTSQTRTRFPWRAATSASAAEMVLFPTPPLPVTTRRRRSRSPCTALDKLATGGGEVHHAHGRFPEESGREARARGGRGARGQGRDAAPVERARHPRRADLRLVRARRQVHLRPRRADRHAGGEPPDHRGRRGAAQAPRRARGDA